MQKQNRRLGSSLCDLLDRSEIFEVGHPRALERAMQESNEDGINASHVLKTSI
jgi:hypothetical protein